MVSKVKKLIKRITKWIEGDEPKWLSGKGR
ncbi:uncharacterized protein METZ01_LOCUS349413 [marine metagenome]|jgi:hypothetical protein|uniref:Uncharacterized protein n=1 Tax=marine metagenome TaxID=408172 RepID=A0A382RFR8_9ZZZZ